MIYNTSVIVGFHRGSLEDKVSLYADDALLYLGDAANCLQTLMDTITKFGEFSVFTINLSKSILMPLDPLLVPLPTGASQIAIATFFKYLGVMVSSDTADYLQLNLGPLLDRQRAKCLSCVNIPFR